MTGRIVGHMRRALVSVRAPETELGALVVEDTVVEWQGAADHVVGALIRKLGSDEAGRLIMSEGWANGAGLYFAEATP